MTAQTSMGTYAQNPLARLPYLRLARTPRKCKTPDTLVFKPAKTGTIAYRFGQPVAWIVEGCHTGKVGNDTATIRFVDVAYHRQTRNGINLETFDCDSLDQAQQALRAIFEHHQTADGFATALSCAATTVGGAA